MVSVPRIYVPTIASFDSSSEEIDIRLPFRNLEDWPSDCRYPFKAFHEKQRQFCVSDPEASKLFDTHFDDKAVLPFISTTQLRKGTNSSTFKVKVHPEYDSLVGDVSKTFILGRDWRKRTRPQFRTYVLKTYSLNNAESYANEVEAYRRLMQRPHVDSEMVKFYDSFGHCRSFNILLEWADQGILEGVFRTKRQPTSGDEIITFWDNFVQLIQALSRIHELPDLADQSRTFQG